MNSVFRDIKIQSQDRKNIIDHNTPIVYVHDPFGYTSSFKRVTDLIPVVVTVTPPTKKRKSKTQMVKDSDIFKYPRASENQKKEQRPVQRRPSFDQMDPLGFVNSLNSLDFSDLLKSLKSMGASDFLGCEDVDFHCYENAEEIFEDIDMEKQLSEITVLPVQKPMWVNGSKSQRLSKNHRVNPVSSELIYPSFQH
jgi:hypothetical protein